MRNTLNKIGLLFVTIVFSFFLGEIFVRVFFNQFVDSKILCAQFMNVAPYIESSENPILRYQLKKGLETETWGLPVITDSDGCRSTTTTVENKTNAIKIAIVGDSSAFGWGVKYETTYANLYAQKMSKETGKTVIVKNYCVPGYNTIQELEVWRTKVKQWNPDLLLIHHDNNDPEPFGITFVKDFIKPEYGNNPLHCALYKFAKRTIAKAIKKNQSRIDQTVNKTICDKTIISEGPLYDEHVKALDSMITEAKENGTESIVILNINYVYQEKNEEIYYKLHKPLKEHFEKNGNNVWDMYQPALDVLKSTNQPNTSFWWVSNKPPFDCHPNPQCHEFMAESLKEYSLKNEKIMSVFEQNA